MKDKVQIPNNLKDDSKEISDISLDQIDFSEKVVKAL